MIKKILAAIGLAFIIFITITLVRFGIFKTVEIKETVSSQKIIYGKYFEGEAKSESFKSVFQEIGKLNESGEINGKVCGAYFNNPENNKGIIKAFIGVWVSDSTLRINDELKYYIIPEREVLQAHLNADFRVATFKCYNAIFEFSKEKNIPISEQFFEWFENREEVFVEVSTK